MCEAEQLQQTHLGSSQRNTALRGVVELGLQALHSAQSLHCSALSPHLVYQTPFARVKQTGGHVPEGSLNLLLESGGVTARAFSAW